MSKIEEVKVLVETGKSKKVATAVQEALDAGEQTKDILDAMIASMGIVGDKFSAGEIFVPEMLIAAKAMSKGCGSPQTADGGRQCFIIGNLYYWHCSRRSPRYRQKSGYHDDRKRRIHRG